MQHRHSLATSPTWAPAFAGVVSSVGRRDRGFQSAASLRPLFSREDGSSVWVPAFAGRQSSRTLALTSC